jgi:hypothetical protein
MQYLITRLKLESKKLITSMVAIGHMLHRCPTLLDNTSILHTIESFVVDSLMTLQSVSDKMFEMP